MRERPNVLLIVLDSIRARNTSLYTYQNDTTPYLETFIEDENATLFERAWAPASWSLPSHVSMFTGYEAEEHGITDSTDKMDPAESVYYELGQHGYETGVFSQNPWITGMDVGIKDGFNRVETGADIPFRQGMNPVLFSMEGGSIGDYLKQSLRHDHPVASIANGAAVKLRGDFPKLAPRWLFNEPSASQYTESFLSWLRNDVDEPWAACVNFMDAHMPYRPADRHNRWGDDTLRQLQNKMDDAVWDCYRDDVKWWRRQALEALYDGSILETDASVQRIIEGLKRMDEYENTLVVITADHGEGFGEHSRVANRRVSGHGRGVHEVLLRVPLVVRQPAQDQTERVSDLSSLRGFADAVERATMNEAGDVVDAFKQERVLASYNEMSEPTREIAEEHIDDISPHDAVGRAVYTEDRGSVKKLASWGDKAAEIRVQDVHTAWRTKSIQIEDIEDIFASLDSADINVGVGESEIDDDVERRLEDLGYR